MQINNITNLGDVDDLRSTQVELEDQQERAIIDLLTGEGVTTAEAMAREIGRSRTNTQRDALITETQQACRSIPPTTIAGWINTFITDPHQLPQTGAIFNVDRYAGELATYLLNLINNHLRTAATTAGTTHSELAGLPSVEQAIAAYMGAHAERYFTLSRIGSQHISVDHIVEACLGLASTYGPQDAWEFLTQVARDALPYADAGTREAFCAAVEGLNNPVTGGRYIDEWISVPPASDVYGLDFAPGVDINGDTLATFRQSFTDAVGTFETNLGTIGEQGGDLVRAYIEAKGQGGVGRNLQHWREAYEARRRELERLEAITTDEQILAEYGRYVRHTPDQETLDAEAALPAMVEEARIKAEALEKVRLREEEREFLAGELPRLRQVQQDLKSKGWTNMANWFRLANNMSPGWKKKTCKTLIWLSSPLHAFSLLVPFVGKRNRQYLVNRFQRVRTRLSAARNTAARNTFDRMSGITTKAKVGSARVGRHHRISNPADVVDVASRESTLVGEQSRLAREISGMERRINATRLRRGTTDAEEINELKFELARVTERLEAIRRIGRVVEDCRKVAQGDPLDSHLPTGSDFHASLPEEDKFIYEDIATRSRHIPHIDRDVLGRTTYMHIVPQPAPPDPPTTKLVDQNITDQIRGLWLTLHPPATIPPNVEEAGLILAMTVINRGVMTIHTDDQHEMTEFMRYIRSIIKDMCPNR